MKIQLVNSSEITCVELDQSIRSKRSKLIIYAITKRDGGLIELHNKAKQLRIVHSKTKKFRIKKKLKGRLIELEKLYFKLMKG